MKKLFWFLAYAVGIVSIFIPGLHELWIIHDWYVFFYHGKLMISSVPLYLEDGQLVYNNWLGIESYTISILFAVVLISIIVAVIRKIIISINKMAERKSDKSST